MFYLSGTANEDLINSTSGISQSNPQDSFTGLRSGHGKSTLPNIAMSGTQACKVSKEFCTLLSRVSGRNLEAERYGKGRIRGPEVRDRRANTSRQNGLNQNDVFLQR